MPFVLDIYCVFFFKEVLCVGYISGKDLNELNVRHSTSISNGRAEIDLFFALPDLTVTLSKRLAYSRGIKL